MTSSLATLPKSPARFNAFLHVAPSSDHLLIESGHVHAVTRGGGFEDEDGELAAEVFHDSSIFFLASAVLRNRAEQPRAAVRTNGVA